MTAFWTLLVFGGFWFWAVLAVVSILIIAFLENEKAAGATLLSIGTILALIFMGNNGVFAWIGAHPIKLILYILGYVGVGVLYSILKWYLLLRDRKDAYRETRTKWLERQIGKDTPKKELYQAALSTGVMDPAIKELWRKYLDNEYYGSRRLRKPLVSRNKGRIVAWMTYWPWSGLWTLINDPVRRTFRFLYRRISTTLQRMSDKMFADIESELED